MHWRELERPLSTASFPPLVVTVEAADLASRRPSWRVELSDGGRMRVVCNGEALLWSRVHFALGQWILCADSSRARLASVPPIDAATARSIDAPAGTREWWRAWARWFARSLVESNATPLFAGEWQLMEAREWNPHWPRAEQDYECIAAVDFRHDVLSSEPLRWRDRFHDDSLVPARLPSPPDSGRMKSWRKHARAETLPPVLALGVLGMSSLVVIDGHDRLHAAILEKKRPRVMALWAVAYDHRTSRPEVLAKEQATLEAIAHTAAAWREQTVREMNRRFLWAYGADRYRHFTTRAYPVPGGHATWDREVASRLAEIGSDAPRDLRL